MLHSRVLKLVASADGSLLGAVSVPPSRFAGIYYQFVPSNLQPELRVNNLGRQVFHTPQAHNADGVQDELPPVEPLVSGPVTVSVGTVAAGDQADVQVFFDFGT